MPPKLFAKHDAFYRVTQAAAAEVLSYCRSTWLAKTSWCRDINLTPRWLLSLLYRQTVLLSALSVMDSGTQ